MTGGDFTEADERAWVAFAASRSSAPVMGGYVVDVREAARFADGLLVELRRRRPAERKEGPYR